MKNEIRDYSEAVENHMNALKKESVSKQEVMRTRHALLMAKEALKAREWDLLTA